ncbi:MAG TPA: hypothetical protein VHU80_20760 [Polyangiaceae bacterium]|jgi:hypothetical protein|nr:hypothetical protein [Polyangiaceae bacterium]
MATARPPATRHPALSLLALLLLSSRPGHGQNASRLIVDRTDGAEQCPDEAALAERVQHIRERTDLGKAAYRVAFSRTATGLTVSITAEPSGRARTLTSGDASCDAIANAAAVTLALLFDAEPVEPPARPAPPPPPRAPPPKPHPATPAAPSPLSATLAASFVYVAGVTGAAAFGGTLEAGVSTSRFRTSVGALWTAPVRSSLAPGHVQEGLVGGVARACFAPITGMRRLDACSGAIVGLTSARAEGYSRNETRDRPWLAIPIELAGSFWTRRFGVELGAAALFPVVRHDFGIDGLGVPYRSSAVGAMASLALISYLPL